MQWAGRQHQTGRKQKFLVGILFGMLATLFIPLIAAPASAHALSLPTHLVRATTIVADDTSDIDACKEHGGNLSWVICPIFDMLHGAVNFMQSAIDHLMQVDVKSVFNRSTDTGAAYYKAWNSFRVLGIAIIVIAGLIMVISTALGFEFFDAYTIKKVLPRILVAIIGISLSWWLLEYLAELTNDVGVGIRSLIYYPFKDLAQSYGGMQSVGSSLIGAIAIGGGFVILGIGAVLSLIATAALAALVAFLVLVIRQVVIIFLILIAPLAIACYVLPNTQKAYHLWWDSLAKGMMMFPIISAFIAAGQVFAVVASSNPNGSFGLSKAMAVLAYFLPYFMLPFTFRLAGGAIATLGGLVNDRSSGMFDGLKNYRKNQSQKRMAYRTQRVGDRAMQARAQAVRSLNSAANKRGRVAGGLMRFAGGQIAGQGGIEDKMSAINARTGKAIEDEIATGNDSRIRGLTVNKKAVDRMGRNAAISAGLMREDAKGRREYKSLGGAWVGESDVLEGHKRWGNDVAAQQAALSYEMRKANSEAEVQGIASGYHALATQQWGQSETQAGGSWIGAAFQNQNQHLEYKNTDYKTGGLKAEYVQKNADGEDIQGSGLLGAGLVDETYEKRGSYNMAQMGSNTIEQLKEAHASADRVLAGAGYSQEAKARAQDQKEKIKAISETFMHQYGGAGGDEDNAAQLQAEAAGQPQDGRVPVRQANTPGSAHTAERVRELAVLSGAYKSAPSGGYSYPIGRGTGTSAQNRREQG